MRPFAVRFPELFHVADRAALPSIRAHGLLSAERLCARHGLSPEARTALLEQNRDGYAPLGPGVALRWQGMPDGPLARRLAPGLTPAGWRKLINAKVFLFARQADAARLRQREAERDQVVLAFATVDLLARGLDLRACCYNNGYMDRRSLAAPRLRGPADYVPVADWTGSVPKEVVIEGHVPSDLGFRVLPPSA